MASFTFIIIKKLLILFIFFFLIEDFEFDEFLFPPNQAHLNIGGNKEKKIFNFFL
jgi:hypothetical protein